MTATATLRSATARELPPALRSQEPQAAAPMSKKQRKNGARYRLPNWKRWLLSR